MSYQGYSPVVSHSRQTNPCSTKVSLEVVVVSTISVFVRTSEKLGNISKFMLTESRKCSSCIAKKTRNISRSEKTLYHMVYVCTGVKRYKHKKNTSYEQMSILEQVLKRRVSWNKL